MTPMQSERRGIHCNLVFGLKNIGHRLGGVRRLPYPRRAPELRSSATVNAGPCAAGNPEDLDCTLEYSKTPTHGNQRLEASQPVSNTRRPTVRYSLLSDRPGLHSPFGFC